jgi:putative tricarboxylic transport membrane protein
MRLGRDGIAGLIGLAVSLLLLPQALSLPKLPIVPVGPGFYPTIVFAFLGVTSAVLLLQDILAQRRAGSIGAAETPAGPPRAYGLVAAAFLIVAVYIALLPLIGFRIATALFVAAFQLALDRPRTPFQWAMLGGIAVATSALTYLVFETYLLVLLPRGAWTGW